MNKLGQLTCNDWEWNPWESSHWNRVHQTASTLTKQWQEKCIRVSVWLTKTKDDTKKKKKKRKIK